MSNKPARFNDPNDPEHRFGVYNKDGNPVLELGGYGEVIRVRYDKCKKEISIEGYYDDFCFMGCGVITFGDFIKALEIT